MKVREYICLVWLVLVALPLLANAEVYKWRDKNGAMRYTDTPPPADAKQEQMGYKRLKTPTGAAPLSPVTQTTKTEIPAKAAEKNAPNKAGKEGGQKGVSEDDTAKLRQKNADVDKRNNEEQERQAKLKEENCKAAKANHASYAQGGRVYKMNEKGEREYLSDEDLKAGTEKTEKEIKEYCS